MGKSLLFVLLAIVALFALLTVTVDPLGLMGDSKDAASTAHDVDVLTGNEGEDSGPTLKVTIGPDGVPMFDGDPVGTLNLGLGTAVLEGRVVAEDERPIRLARVMAMLPEAEDRGVRTRDDGTFQLRGLPAGRHELRTSATDYRTHSAVAPDVADDQTIQVPPIVLQRIRPHTDFLVVRAQDLFGNPIRGAKVLATTMPWDLHITIGPDLAGMKASAEQGTTDAKGTVRLGPLAPDMYNVVVSAGGFETTPRHRVVVTAGSERTVTIRMPNAVSVSGVVVDAQDNPVAGAFVSGMALPAYRSCMPTETNEQGEFVLEGLKRGAYMFFAYDDSGGESMSHGQAPSSGLKFTLPGAGTIKGRVIDEAGTGIQARVRPFQSGPFRYHYSQTYETNEDGTFEIGVPKGGWIVRAVTDDARVSDDASLKIETGEVTTVELKVVAGRSVRGIVVDAQGNHVEGAHVFIKRGGMPPSPSREYRAYTDAEGAFEIRGFREGTVSLYVEHPLYAGTTFEATPTTESTSPVRVVLGQGARVFGRMTDAAGNPVANETINLVPPRDFMNSRSIDTGGDGSYQFENLAPGAYRMSTGELGMATASLSKNIKLSDGESKEVNWDKPAASGTVTGVVTLGGAPVAGARVTAQDSRGPNDTRSTQTDKEGKFAMEGVEVGRVRIDVKTPDNLTGQATATIDGKTQRGHVTVAIQNAGLRVRLIDVEGQPAPGVWCNIEGADDAEMASAYHQLPVSGADGLVEAHTLPAGTYRMRASQTNFAQFVSDPIQLVGGKVVDLGDITLKPAAQISGRVTNDAGAPVEGATVSLRTADNRPVFLFSMSTTGSDGRYVVRGVESGRYRVRFEASGLAPSEAWVHVADGVGSADGVMARGGNVNFLVVTDTDEPVPGAKLTIYDGAGQVVTKTLSIANWSDTGQRFTDAKGRASIEDLATGGYRVVVEREGYGQTGDGAPVRVGPGATTEARIVVSKNP